MLKNVMVGAALASYAIASIPASATEARPAAVALKAAPQAGAAPVAAAPQVSKKRKLAGLGAAPVIIGVAALGALTLGIAAASDDGDSSSPQ